MEMSILRSRSNGFTGLLKADNARPLHFFGVGATVGKKAMGRLKGAIGGDRQLIFPNP